MQRTRCDSRSWGPICYIQRRPRRRGKLTMRQEIIFCSRLVEICSFEHEPITTVAATARSLYPPPTTRTQPMADTSTSLRRILERIRDDAQQALTVLVDSEEPRSIAWKCSGCGHGKHFTRPVPAEVAAPCPKCGGESFQESKSRSLRKTSCHGNHWRTQGVNWSRGLQSDSGAALQAAMSVNAQTSNAHTG